MIFFRPPSFFENYIATFYDRYGCIYARRYDGQIVQGFRSASFKVCRVLIFLNTIVEQTYPELRNYSFESISCSKNSV